MQMEKLNKSLYTVNSKHLGLAFVFAFSLLFTVMFGLVNILKFRIFSTTTFGWQYFYSYLRITEGKSLFDMCVLPEYPVVAYIFMPFNYPMAFIYKLLPRPESLLILQSAVIASGAFPVYLIAQKYLKHTFLSVVLAISYLLHPVISSGAMLGYILPCFGLPFLLYAFYYLEKENLFRFAIFIFLASMTKIDTVIMLLIFGSTLLFTKSKKKYGVVAVSISLVWLVSLLSICLFLLKSINRPFPAPMLHFDKYGNEMIDALRYFLLNPGLIFKNIFNTKNMLAYIFFIIPNIFCFLKPLYLLPIVPETILLLIRNQHSSGHFLILPFVFTATIQGLGKVVNLINSLPQRYRSGKSLPRKAYNIIAIALLLFLLPSYYLIKPDCDFSLALGPMPFTRNFNLKYYEMTDHVREGYKFLDMISPHSSCLTQQSLATHLGKVDYLGRFDKFTIAKEYAWDYVFIDLFRKDFYQIKEEEYISKLKQFLIVSGYGVMAFEDGWLLLKKGYRQDKNLGLLTILNKLLEEKR